jgi:hypothetical protein
MGMQHFAHRMDISVQGVENTTNNFGAEVALKRAEPISKNVWGFSICSPA